MTHCAERGGGESERAGTRVALINLENGEWKPFAHPSCHRAQGSRLPIRKFLPISSHAFDHRPSLVLVQQNLSAQQTYLAGRIRRPHYPPHIL